MKNKKSLTTAVAIVLLLVVVALAIVSGTFAKYTDEYSGSDTAVVANWNVDVTGITKDASDNVTFELFDASKVYDLSGIASDANFASLTGTVDTDVKNGTTDAIVAPGTWGKVNFGVTVGADTDVSVNYYVKLDSITTTLPIEFSSDGQNWKSATTANGSKIYDENNNEYNPSNTDSSYIFTGINIASANETEKQNYTLKFKKENTIKKDINMDGIQIKARAIQVD